MGSFARAVSGIGVLADPLRRELYLYVCARPESVSREQAAEALDITVHQAKFHLDRMESEGLLVADYARESGRGGPGAGRPAKRYRRSPHEFAVSLPTREYELAGRLMAAAIAESSQTGGPVLAALDRAAAAEGAAIGAAAAGEAASPGRPRTPEAALAIAEDALRRHGYEPTRDDDTITLANCPFHGLVADHPALVCQMNHTLLSTMADRIAPGCLEARLEPGRHACCVVVALSGDRSGE